MKKNKSFFLNIFFIILAVAGLFFGFFTLMNNYRQNKKKANTQVIFPVNEYVTFSEKKVLFISSFDSVFPPLIHEIAGLKKILSKNKIQLDVLFMDMQNYKSTENQMHFYTSLKYKLSNHKKYDTVILGGDSAFLFAEKHREEFFKDVPLIFMGLNDISFAEQVEKNPRNMGIVEKLFIKETLEVALKHNPSAKQVVALFDDSPTGLGEGKQFLEQQKNFPNINLIPMCTSNCAKSELGNFLETLDENTILLFLSFSNDGDDNIYSLYDAINFIVKHTNKLPIYRTSIGGIGSGVFGGKIFNHQKLGELAAQMAVDIILHERMPEQRVIYDVDGKFFFDYKILKKLHLSKRKLPKDSEFVNCNSYWQKNSNVILTLFFFLSALLILLILTIKNYMNLRRTQMLINIRNRVIERKNIQLKTSEEKMRKLSENDYLTMLPNRMSAVEEINKLINKKTKFSVYMIDIDNFKNINDFYNHECGDFILKEFSNRLNFLAEKMDCFVARYGGDEFVLLYKNSYLTEGGTALETIQRTLAQPVEYKNIKLNIKFTGGIAQYIEGIQLSEMLGNSDMALNEAKKQGKNKTLFFHPDMKKAITAKNEIAKILESALKNDGFLIKYQPQIDAETGEIHSYEALVRLEGNPLSPNEFIPVAEESGYIMTIGRIVTEKVIAQMAEWRKQGIELKKVSINYSSGQLIDTEYVGFLKSLLEKYEISSALVELEVTENLFMGNSSLARKLFNELSKIGVALALDDFGTGYSSLSYLTYLPVSKVKIDKSLVDNYLIEGKDSFIKNIVKLVHDLGMELTVEGVEQQWQCEKLKKIRCDYIQGYYYSAPITGEEITELKKNQNQAN
ncbi:GGDEF and EAL domain-containing protein [Treponema zioleckii]|uniref:GGDEF and EAL domain-containing protein n=1 Tax=Treponema zioleckii TaxID=331680 RepID=UPI00168AF962|nr:GGDEF and EAL domain-containing protein [Treponema zioleckii]